MFTNANLTSAENIIAFYIQLRKEFVGMTRQTYRTTAGLPLPEDQSVRRIYPVGQDGPLSCDSTSSFDRNLRKLLGIAFVYALIQRLVLVEEVSMTCAACNDTWARHFYVLSRPSTTCLRRRDFTCLTKGRRNSQNSSDF